MKKEYDNGDLYEGEVKNNLPHGKGIFKFISGEEEIGEFFEGELLNGKTIKIQLISYPEDEDIIDEKIQNMKFSTIVMGKKETFEDTKGKLVVKTFWENDEPLINYTYKNELDLYVGEIHNGQQHGKGKLKKYLPSLDEEKPFLYQYYDGEWKNGKKHGFGIEKVFLSSEYEGYWSEDKYHGEGKRIQYWDEKEVLERGEDISFIEEGIFENGVLKEDNEI